jgi:hypothetical protein
MANTKKLIQAAAGAVGGAGLNVEEVFSTYLYDGTGATQSITNDIDLSGEGGMTWLKVRSLNGYDHSVYDTERGATKRIVPNSTGEEFTRSGGLTSFNGDGFTLGNAGDENQSNANIVSWTFRKAPKFFDVVTYTGDGTSATSRNIPHNLGCAPGLIVLKRLDSATNWEINALNSSGSYERLRLNLTSGSSGTQTGHTDTTFHTITSSMNTSGGTYVAYLFAHNDGDGEFGPDGDQDIIKCGSYTGNGSSTNGPEIDLGFEPEWVVIKRTDASGGWHIGDSMRGIANGSADPYLTVNQSDEGQSFDWLSLSATGFSITTGSQNINLNGGSYIYIAIRRGPMAVPESATDVFAIDTYGGGPPAWTSGFPVDMAIWKDVTASAATSPYLSGRLMSGQFLQTATTSIENTLASHIFDFQDGWNEDTGSNSSAYSWMWRRAPNFFDVVSYTGDGVAGSTVSHNLGVVPEMMWVKGRDIQGSWPVYHKDIDVSYLLWLDLSSALAGPYSPGAWNGIAPTSTEFTVSSSGWGTNNSGQSYIAFLFCSLDGISKVGSYTGNNSSQNIDCGFSSGARFVLIKRVDANAQEWVLFDSQRGIVAGNDPILELSHTGPQYTGGDDIDPYSAGFTINNDETNGYALNQSGVEYIFYAIA